MIILAIAKGNFCWPKNNVGWKKNYLKKNMKGKKIGW